MDTLDLERQAVIDDATAATPAILEDPVTLRDTVASDTERNQPIESVLSKSDDEVVQELADKSVQESSSDRLEMNTVLATSVAESANGINNSPPQPDKGHINGMDKVPEFKNEEAIHSTEKEPRRAHSYTSKAVTAERKQQLLLEARESRKRWLARVSVPYRVLDEGNSNDFLGSLRQTHAFSKLPTAGQLLRELYHGQTTQEVAQLEVRIRTLIDDNDRDLLYPTGRSILATALASSDDSYLQAYAHFWKSLHDPACSMIVQNMRNTCLKLKLTKEDASTILYNMTESMYTALKQHAVFKDQQQLRRCLEAFVLGHCSSKISVLYSNAQADQAENDFREKLDKLQFLTLRHLDASIADIDLSKAVSAIRSVDKYYSVYDKLQRVLALYQGINEALHAALQVSGSSKPPSADDVLPSIIYTLIQAKPENILRNLQMIEELARPEYLRGEAGYAFTNLYGGVQFLLELDLDQPLNMSPSEWKEAKEKCVKAASMREMNASPVAQYVPMQRSMPLLIPPCEIRKARARGEVVDVEWARHWQEENGTISDGVDKETASETNSKVPNIDSIVPKGFNRSYAYLGSRPEDLRLTDLEPLLVEYKLLVQATETLIGEQRRLQQLRREMETFSARDLVYRQDCLACDSNPVEDDNKPA